MITAIEIENFKGIGERVKIDLKPITLLFGANSSGKSTIIQAIHYAREIFERHNLDPDRTLHGGDYLDLGGFQNLVHNRDLSKPIILKFYLDLHDVDLPDYGFQNSLVTQMGDFYRGYQADHGLYREVDIDSFSREIKDAWIEISIEWSESLNPPQPQLTRYTIGLNQNEFASIVASRDGKKVTMEDFNLNHPFIQKKEKENNPETLGNFIYSLENLLGIVRKHSNDKSDTISLFFNIPTQKSALPKWGHKFEEPDLWTGVYEILYEDKHESIQFTYLERQEFLILLTQAMVGPGQLLRDELRKFRYLGPIREIPPRYFEAGKSKNEFRWANGLAAWDILSQDDKLVPIVSDWMSREDRLNTGYSLDLKKYREIESTNEVMLMLKEDRALEAIKILEEELEKLPEKKRLLLIEEKTGIEVLPPDVGVGISQVLPVVVAALSSDEHLIAIEQPELHIHPAIQVALGDLFINQIKKSDSLFLIETHSEHLMLRLLRRIQETTEEELPSEEFSLKPDQVSVYYIKQKESNVEVIPLRIDKEGEFIDRWPHGFFDERAEELF
ncbi:MAG: DUF3696 domain-containing protein [Candidatus Omnitrophota bacterium]|jgi:hypothetical protein|nr:MAG: DUF3696 domain-containing protein [Candidatus Omnitrophota bacterium]